MRIFISGPISTIAGHNKPAFLAAQARAQAQGHEAIIPHDVLPYRPELTWSDYMRATLRALLTCDEVRVLPGWQCSRGAVLEVDVARRLWIPVLPAGSGASERELRALDDRAP